MSNGFNLSKFLADINNPDDDYTVIAFENLIRYLNSVKKFDLDPDRIKYTFLTPVIDRLNDKMPDIVNPLLRIIVLFAEKLPKSTLQVFFENIFEIIYEDDFQIRDQVLTIFKEILSNSVSFKLSRQKIFVSYIYTKLEMEIKQNMKNDISVFNFDLMTSLLENLGFLLTEKQLQDISLVIRSFITKEHNNAIFPHLCFLTRAYMTQATTDQFNSLLSFLFEQGNAHSNVYSIISSMIYYKPSLYAQHASQLIKLFIEQIRKVEDEQSQLDQENMESDVSFSSSYIQNLSEYISSLAVLTETFPEINNEETVEDFISIVFQYFIYGLNDYEENDANGEEDKDDDFDVEGEDEMDEIDDTENVGDDSWKIRKSAMEFASIIIKNYPEKFYESLSYKDEEVDCLAVVETLLKDSDSGAQKSAFSFLNTIIQYYKDQLDKDSIILWYRTLLAQLVPTKQKTLNIILETISSVISESKFIPNDTTLQIISKIPPILSNETIPCILMLFNTIFCIAQPEPEIVIPITSILIDIIKKGKIRSQFPYLQVSANLFQFVFGSKQSNESLAIIDSLAHEIVSLTKSKDKSHLAYETLGVYVSSSTSKYAEEVLSVLVDAFKNNIAIKPVSCAIALAASSNYNLISNKSTQIIISLLPLLKQENNLVFIFLWILKLLLEKGNYEQAICENIANSLINILDSHDSRNRSLALKVLNLIPSIGSNSDFLEKLKSCLVNNLNNGVSEAAAILIDTLASTNPNNVKEMIQSFLLEDYNPEISTHIAYIIGYSSARHFDTFGKVILENLMNKILSNKVSILSLLCVGEIGSLINIGSYKNLVDTIFNLLSNNERTIFNTAAECIGLISVGNIDEFLPRILSRASEEDETTISTYILSILSMTKKLSSSSFIQKASSIVGSQIECIKDFLYSKADFNKPTERSIAQSFANLMKIDSNLLNEVIDIIKGTTKRSGTNGESLYPVLAHSIFLLFEETPIKQSSKLFENVVNIIDLTKPMVTYYLLQCVLRVLNNPKYIPNHDSIESILYQASKFNESVHIVTEQIGIQSVKKDIGKLQRSIAIDCLISIVKFSSYELLVNELISTLIEILSDPSAEIRTKGLMLLCEMSLSNDLHNELINSLHMIIGPLKKIENSSFDDSTKNIDRQDSFLKTIACLRKLTEKQKNPDIEHIYLKYKGPKIYQFETDINYSTTSTSTPTNLLTPGNPSINLMNKFNPEASAIFTI